MDPIARMVAAGAAGAAGAGDATYVDDVFSTYVYDGTGSTQTINNGIDLSGEGGLVWFKNRSTGVGVPLGHVLQDTERGNTKFLRSQSSSQEETSSSMISSFNSNGFTFGSDTNINYNGDNGVAWTFRKAPGFFDVVTYTGSGSPKTVSHSLGSTPGMIIVKCTSDGSTDWTVFHRKNGHPAYSNGGSAYASFLNTDAAADPSAAYWNNTVPTSTVFTVGTGDKVNGSGKTYVAYLFAHDDQSFGTSGNESIIKCGSFTTPSSGSFTVDLGFEPQWLMIKRFSSSGGSWVIRDVMRGWDTAGFERLFAESSSAEQFTSSSDNFPISSTGFGSNTDWLGASTSYIYMAIRRPHKPPTAATEVYYQKTGAGPYVSGFPVDMWWSVSNRSSPASFDPFLKSRLLGGPAFLVTSGTNAIATGSSFSWDNNNGVDDPFSFTSGINWMFRRAPGFFDIVAFEGTGVARTLNHNLAAIPEFVIVKNRENSSYGWSVYVSHLSSPRDKAMYLNDTMAAQTNTAGTFWGNSDFTSTQISLGSYANTNHSGIGMIAYLFASLDGISKIGTYSGTGSNIDVDCGFSAGARFVLIKRTDTEISGATGTNWYLFDSARGIVSGNDPYLLVNSTTAEVTNTDYIDPLNAGFTVTSSAIAALNASGGTYMFLAIA